MTIPDSEPREQERLALANIDMNIPEPMADNPVGKKRNIGIVVTGLSTSQIVSITMECRSQFYEISSHVKFMV